MLTLLVVAGARHGLKSCVLGALEGLPLLAAALESGAAVNGSVVRQLTRVVTGEAEGEWLAAARGLSARQVEALVSGAGQARPMPLTG